MFEKLKRNTVQVARPRPQMVHGIEIKKQPVGRYFEVMDRAGGMVGELLGAAFPDQTPRQILEDLTKLTPDGLKALAMRLFGLLPRKLVEILREIVGAQDNPAWDELTPAEMTAVVKAFWQLNDMTDFFTNARSATQQLLKQKQTADTGSNG